jgi:hypothetical protein
MDAHAAKGIVFDAQASEEGCVTPKTHQQSVQTVSVSKDDYHAPIWAPAHTQGDQSEST